MYSKLSLMYGEGSAILLLNTRKSFMAIVNANLLHKKCKDSLHIFVMIKFEIYTVLFAWDMELCDILFVVWMDCELRKLDVNYDKQ